MPYVIKYNATKPTKFASFPKYKEYVADERYVKIARRVGLCSADTPISEAVDCLVKAIRELMTVTERPLCIKDCGVSEAEFMSKVDELSYKAFEDQCTTANPVHPWCPKSRSCTGKLTTANRRRQADLGRSFPARPPFMGPVQSGPLFWYMYRHMVPAQNSNRQNLLRRMGGCVPHCL
ncbi:MAG: iron-containing alcohol dehydrogenase [Ruthenibacterium lactatiformans]